MRKSVKWRLGAALTAVLLLGGNLLPGGFLSGNGAMPGSIRAQAADGLLKEKGVFGNASADSGGQTKQEISLHIGTPENKVPVYVAGEKKEFVLEVENDGVTALKNVTVRPKLGETSNDWPFETEYQSYVESVPELKSGEKKTIQFTFIAREDADAGRHVVTFEIGASNEAGEEILAGQRAYYVNIKEKPAESTPGKDEESNPGGDQGSPGDNSLGSGGSQNMEDNGGLSDTQTGGDTQNPTGWEEQADLNLQDPLLSDAGGFDNVAGQLSSGGSEGVASVPRVIVTGFSTDPAEVKAGSDFKLIIHLKNTSKKVKVSNLLFELAAPVSGDNETASPAFLPTSGSNSIYLDSIGANGTADISIQLNAKADLVQKPYEINLTMVYEDDKASQIEGSSSVSIPVKQEPRFEFSKFEVMPETIEVGGEANVTCSLYNLGKVKLYNVRALFEGDDIETQEVFLGNVDMGQSASIDAMLTGASATTGEGKVKMTLSYEDESGRVTETQKEIDLTVEELLYEETEDMMNGDTEPEEQSGGISVGWIILGGAVLLIVVIILVRRRKKKKQELSLMMDEEELMNEPDRPSEDERG